MHQATKHVGPSPILTDHQVAHFRREGFVVVGPLVGPGELNALRTAFTELTERYAADIGVPTVEYIDVVSQITHVWPHHPTFERQLQHPAVASIARTLLGAADVQLFHDHLITKPPHGGDTIPWHRDFPNWPLSAPRALSCWLALDDVTPASGAMVFMPGTHTEPVTPAVDFLNDRTEWGERASDARAVGVPAGWAVFHDNLVWHMSPPNATDRWRRAYITILFDSALTFDPSTAGWHPMAKRFQPIEGAQFPTDTFPIVGRKAAA